VDFFAGEAIDVGAGQRAAAGDCVSEGIISITGGQRLAAVHQVRDVAVAIGMVEIVIRPIAAGVAIGTAEEAADSSRALEPAAQVDAACVADRRVLFPSRSWITRMPS